MASKWFQKSSKIDAEIEVGKKFEKVTLRMAPVSSGLYRDFSFGHPFSGENGPKRHPKNHEKVETEKVSTNDAKGLKRLAKCFQNGSKMGPTCDQNVSKMGPKKNAKLY